MSVSLYCLHLICLCLYVGVKSASIATFHTPDGFGIDHFMPGRTFSYGVAPNTRGEDMTLSFYDVDVSSDDCDSVQVDVYDDGYVKSDFNRIAIMCDRKSLEKFSAVSHKGFHVVITMGAKVNRGGMKARFTANGGLTVTNEVLY